jgi:SAM-dependent methyltransferase
MAGSPKKARPLRDLLRYTNAGVLAGFLRRYDLGAREVEALWRDLLALLWLGATRELPAVYPGVLDELWRELLCRPADYVALSERYLGGRLVEPAPWVKLRGFAGESDEALDASIRLVYTALGKETATRWFDTLTARYTPRVLDEAHVPWTGARARVWARFSARDEARGPSKSLASALRRFERRAPVARLRHAVDLGCGRGRDTRVLLAQGWRVTAIDVEPTAIAALLEAVPAAERARLAVRCARFEDVADLPRCDLLNASMSLPFCEAARFSEVWRRIVGAIRKGGRFAGDFLGARDDWAREPGRAICLSDDAIRALFAEFRVERFATRERVTGQVLGATKRWHVISVVARKTA